MRRAVSTVVAAGLTGMIWTGLAWAEPTWVQIEARPQRAQAEERARDWAGQFPDVSGYAMTTGWYAIALGPFATAEEADAQMRALKREGKIPPDSYLADGKRFGAAFWPAEGAAAEPAAEPAADPAAEAPAEPPAPVAEAEPAPEAAVETLADSRRLEAALPRETRMEIQSALQWQGFYASAIDGAFGRGTRASIAAWQEAQGAEPTGVLSSAQQAALLEAVAADRAALGLAPVEEPEAGIAIELPLGLVEFDHYDPPFVHYRAKDGSGVSVLLISEPGDENALFGLYDVMQTLEIVPVEGERERGRSAFRLTGQNDKIHSHTEAALSGGLIKGFTLVYPAADEARMARVLAAMQASFKPMGTKALDPTLGKPLAVNRADLLSGLDKRHPEFARTGVYLAAKGDVLTAAAGLDACARVTLEDQPAKISFLDAGLGVAVITPENPTAAPAVARFQTAELGAGLEIAVAGFSYPEALSAPVLSFGTLSDLSGLAGEAAQARLAVRTLPGDAGGAVIDPTGAVMGMLLPAAATPDKRLPEDLAVAVQARALAPVLTAAGFAPEAATETRALPAEDLSDIAQKISARVACWN